jgi:8-oxo-dGTP pyrophosphatase MutT (NUDIX family)
MEKILCAMKALIIEKGKFLIVKDSGLDEKAQQYFFWDLPGGKPKYGESPYAALHREVKEELGIEVIIQKTEGMFFFYTQDKRQVMCTVFRCIPKNTDIDTHHNPSPAEKLSEFRWVTKEEFLTKEHNVLHESIKELIRNAIIQKSRQSGKPQKAV